jgi:hypothetical protein
VTLFWCLNDIYTDTDAVQMPGGRVRSIADGLLNALREKTRTYFLLKTLLFDRPKSYYQFDSGLYSNPEKLDNCIGIIDRIAAECRERNTRFDIVLLPYEYKMRKENGTAPGPQEIMTDALRPMKITVFNPLRVIRDSEAKSKNLFLYGDGIHLSIAAGCRIQKGSGLFH